MMAETRVEKTAPVLPSAISEPLSSIVSRHSNRENFVYWCGLIAFILGTLVVMVLVDLWLEIDSSILRTIGLGIALLVEACFAYCWYQIFERNFGVIEAAWKLERFFPHLNERVVSMVSLSDAQGADSKTMAGSAQLISALGRETVEKMAIVDASAIPIRSNRNVLACTTVVFAAFLSIVVFCPEGLVCSLRNWILPWSTSIFPELQIELEPGDTTVEYGDDLIVEAIGLSKNATAFLEYENESESKHLTVSQGVIRSATLQDLRQQTTYRLRLGKRISRDYVVRVSTPAQTETVPEEPNKPLEEAETKEPSEADNPPNKEEADPSFQDILDQQEELRRDLDATRQKLEEAMQLIDQTSDFQNPEQPELSDVTEKNKEELLQKASEKTAESRELTESLEKKIDQSNLDLQNSASELRELAKKELSDAQRQLDQKDAKDQKSKQAESAAEARNNLEKAKEKLDELKQVMEEKQKTLSDAAELEKVAEAQKKLAEELSEDAPDPQSDEQQADLAPSEDWREKQNEILKELNELREEDQADPKQQPEKKEQEERQELIAEACEKCKSAANAPSRREARENAQSAAEKLSQMVDKLGKKPNLLKNCAKCRKPGEGDSKTSSKAGNQPNGTKSVTEAPFERLPLRGGASSGWTGAKRQLKSDRLDGRESMIPEDYRDVVTNYFEALANEASESQPTQEDKVPQQ